MDLDAFSAKLRDLFAGDPRAGRPVDRRFRAVVDDVPGMATESKLALLNLAAAHLGDGEAYLEVGSFKGLSLIGAMLDNPGRRFYTMESFLEFNLDARALREELLGNLRRWVDLDQLELLEGDCFELLRRRPGVLREPVGAYFYDGAHGRLPHYLALGVAERWLADRALVVVDDASWPIAWRLAAYGLVYRPATRIAWRTLPRHPKLCAALLKVVPTSSRRVGGARDAREGAAGRSPARGGDPGP